MMAVTLAKDAVTLTRTHPNQWVWYYDPIPMGLALCLGSKGRRVEANGCKGKRVDIGQRILLSAVGIPEGVPEGIPEDIPE
jgi:hypothetical protein